MPKNRCPKCPNCGTQMSPDGNGLCKCPECRATYIPGEVTGVFVPCSIIGIH
jgi:tRNA(Ile2) C34 agmatinyltransferase TiaS